MQINMQAISKLLSGRSKLALIIFVVLFAFIWLFPPQYLYFLKGLSSYLPLHMLMETFSIIVAAMIFAVGWEAYMKEKSGNIVIISTAFLAVVFIDFAHMLSFAGMPPFVTPADPEKAIFFWLCGRFVVAFGMLYIAINTWKPLKSTTSHYLILSVSLIATVLVYWVGLWHQDILPHTFIPGKGLTPLKIYLEWSVVLLLVVAAVFMVTKMLIRKQEYDAENILMAIFLMIMSEIFFMLYADVADLYNFMGHVYKVIAYYYLYRAIFADNIHKPYLELDKSKTMVMDLYNNAPCGYHSIDKDGVFVNINDTELSWLGYTREEMVGKMKFSDMLTPSSLEIFRKNFPIFREHGWVKDMEFEVVRKDGSVFFVLVSATAVKDESGNFLMSRSTLYDITDIRKAEKALEKSEERYRTLIRKIEAAVVVHKADTSIITCNPKAQELLGLTEEQLLGKTAMDPAWHFYHQDRSIMPYDEYPVNQVFRTRQSLRNLIVGVHRPARENDVWVLVNADPVFDDDGSIEQVIVTFSDISEMVRVEEYLRESEGKFAAAFHASPNLMAITRVTDGVILDVNEGYSLLLGYSRDESIGKTTGELSIWANPVDRSTFISAIEKYGQITDFETKLRRKDGTIISVIDSVRTIELKGEKCILSVVYDITERKRMENELHERDRHSQSLLRLSKNLELAQSYADVLKAAEEEVGKTIGYKNIWVYLFSEDKKYAYSLAAGGSMSDIVMSGKNTARLTITGDPMLEEIASAQDIVVVEDAQTDPRTDKKIVIPIKNRTLINVPIIFFGRNMGSVGMGTFGDEGIRVPTKAEEEYLRALASHLAVTLDRIHLLAEREKAEEALKKSEFDIRSLVEYSPVAMLVDVGVETDEKILLINQTFTKLFGYTIEDIPNVLHWWPLAYPDEKYREELRIEWGKRVEKAIQSHGAIEPMEANVTCKDGSIRYARISLASIGERNIITFEDLTERKKAEAEILKLNRIYRMLSDCNQALIRADDETRLIKEVCRVITEEGGYMMAWVGYPQNDKDQTVKPVAYAGYEEGYLSQRRFSWGDNEYGRGPTGMAIRTGKYFITLNYDTDPRFIPWRDEAKKRGYSSSVAFPLMTDGKPFGALSIYGGMDDVFNEGEVNLLQELAYDLAFGISTLRIRAERERAQVMLNEAQRIAHVGSWELDLVTNILSWSDEIYRMFEIDPARFGTSYEAFLNAIHPDDRDAVNFAYTNSLETKLPYSIDHRLLFPDGRIKYVHEQCETYYDKDGKPLRSVGTVQDITELKLAEQEIRHVNAYNRSLIDVSLDPLVTISPDGKITDVNAATEAVTGHSRNELIGMDFSDYFTDPDKARAGYREVFAVGFVRDYPLEIKKKDGYITPVLYNASLYKDETGKIIGVFAAARDITKLKIAEEELRHLNEELEQKVKERTSQLESINKELEAFTYSVSHDLRAPLRSIDGFSSVVMEDYGDKLGEDGKGYLQRVRNASSKMAQLIDDLLSLSRLTRGELNKTSVNISIVAENVIKTLREAEPSRAVEVAIAENMNTNADPRLMDVVLTNLLNNAWKFTSKKDKAQIEVGSIEKDGRTVYYIKDNGAGFDMNYASKIFQPFQRLHTEADFPGTGIGLATVYRIIKKHGGEIWTEARVNEGAVFYFTLGE